MGTEVLRPHDCLAARSSRRPRRHAGRMTARRGHGHGHGASGDRRASAAAAPRQVRTKAVADAYAGPAFGSMSPSPRALPLPRFSSKQAATDAAAAAGVDDSATRELRRLLGLH